MVINHNFNKVMKVILYVNKYIYLNCVQYFILSKTSQVINHTVNMDSHVI